jgi:hypothetical protein
VNYYQDLIDSLCAEPEADPEAEPEAEPEAYIVITKLNYSVFKNDILNSCNSELVNLNEFNFVNDYKNNISFKDLHIDFNGLHVNTCGSTHEKSLFEIVNNSNSNPNAEPFVPKNFNDSLYLNTSTCENLIQDFDSLVPSPYAYSNMCLHQCDASVSASNDFKVFSSNENLDYTMPDFDGRGPSLGSHDKGLVYNSNNSFTKCNSKQSDSVSLNNLNNFDLGNGLSYLDPDLYLYSSDLHGVSELVSVHSDVDYETGLVVNSSNSITKCNSKQSDSVSINHLNNFDSGNGLSYLDPDLDLYSSDLHGVNELVSVHNDMDYVFDPLFRGKNLLHVVSGTPFPLSYDYDQMDVCKYHVHDGVVSSYDALFDFDNELNSFDLDFNVNDIMCEIKF